VRLKLLEIYKKQLINTAVKIISIKAGLNCSSNNGANRAVNKAAKSFGR